MEFNYEFLSEGSVCITGYHKNSTQKDLIIPEFIEGYRVAKIGDGTFRNCSSLTSIHIPDSVTSIGVYAFRDCSSLTSIHIPNSVTSIGNYAFSGCKRLSAVTIPKSTISIGEQAFSNCPLLIVNGFIGSEAERYAEENGLIFNDISVKPAKKKVRKAGKTRSFKAAHTYVDPDGFVMVQSARCNTERQKSKMNLRKYKGVFIRELDKDKNDENYTKAMKKIGFRALSTIEEDEVVEKAIKYLKSHEINEIVKSLKDHNAYLHNSLFISINDNKKFAIIAYEINETGYFDYIPISMNVLNRILSSLRKM